MNQSDIEHQSGDSYVQEKQNHTSEMTTFIDVNRDRFPFCIVWTAIPCLTWLFPVVGHMGIADSKGIIYDFAGPYTIGQDDMAFGRPVRYVQLDPRKAKKSVLENPTDGATSTEQNWNRAVDIGNQVYSRRMHNLCCDNCHSHVACILNSIAYNGRQDWNMIYLALWLTLAGKHVSFSRTIMTYLPFCIVFTGILLWALYA
eukprot:gb/GECG01016201.1/.p1 GENE.gb/GECG01016201.1/~~gb/GECG01016201.1/.p1  ORF type:complete len:201 (+),score=6.68 gb/GECG01016201.1/:1-603(+)